MSYLKENYNLYLLFSYKNLLQYKCTFIEEIIMKELLNYYKWYECFF